MSPILTSEPTASTTPTPASTPTLEGASTQAKPADARPTYESHFPGFTVATEVIVLALVMVTADCDLKLFPMLALSLASLVYMIVARQARAAFSMLIYLAVLGPIYVGYMAYGMRPVFLSPIQIYQAWNTFPVLAAAWIVFMTPPGMISASLARIHCPKKIILGVLVFLRFFPTFTASWRLLRDALRKRGLSRPTQMITDPLDTYEYVMVPSLLALVDSADQLSSSAVTRAAEAPHARTSYYNIPVRTKDVVCVVIAGIVCASVYYANGLVA